MSVVLIGVGVVGVCAWDCASDGTGRIVGWICGCLVWNRCSRASWRSGGSCYLVAWYAARLGSYQRESVDGVFWKGLLPVILVHRRGGVCGGDGGSRDGGADGARGAAMVLVAAWGEAGKHFAAFVPIGTGVGVAAAIYHFALSREADYCVFGSVQRMRRVRGIR